jgi:hypothetical protein
MLFSYVSALDARLEPSEWFPFALEQPADAPGRGLGL